MACIQYAEAIAAIGPHTVDTTLDQAGIEALGFVTGAHTTPACLTADANGDAVFDGCNVHIRNGSGTTDGPVNTLGNLIIGYNEEPAGGLAAGNRDGSHNLIIGRTHRYLSFGAAGAHSRVAEGAGKQGRHGSEANIGRWPKSF